MPATCLPKAGNVWRRSGPAIAGVSNWTAQLDRPADVEGFRRAVRSLLAAEVAPDHVHWQIGASEPVSLFGAEPAAERFLPSAQIERLPAAPLGGLKLPPTLVQELGQAALHRSADRFDLLYQLLWRLAQQADLRHDGLDALRLQVQQMAREVRLDLHKMRAYVRFRPVRREAEEDPWHVAWFEPRHHILEANAGFFIRRFANLRWAILSPETSLAWDGRQLEVGAGAPRHAAPKADADEALWLTYYAHIFNPARLNLSVMAKEMPRRYWHNLPEAALIEPLARAASRRTADMLAKAPSVARRGARAFAIRASCGSAASSGLSATERSAGLQPEAALAALRQAAADCQRCPLHAPATQTVFGEGPARATLMLVGEQPGDQEDLRGRAFVGPAGQFLDEGLAEIQVDRDQTYVTNAVKHFKFELRGKRRLHKTPLQQEAAACLDWLDGEIAAVRPKVAVALGSTAARALLGRPVAIMRERGQGLTRPDGLRVLVTWHPAALLRMPEAERLATRQLWLADLKQAAALAEAVRPPFSSPSTSDPLSPDPSSPDPSPIHPGDLP